MAKDEKNKESAPMEYEVRHVTSARRVFREAIDREETSAEVPAEKVERVEVATTSDKGGKKKES